MHLVLSNRICNPGSQQNLYHGLVFRYLHNLFEYPQKLDIPFELDRVMQYFVALAVWKKLYILSGQALFFKLPGDHVSYT